LSEEKALSSSLLRFYNTMLNERKRL